jgi:hypothetical protein
LRLGVVERALLVGLLSVVVLGVASIGSAYADANPVSTISDATGGTYVLTAGDAGKTIRGVVSATNTPGTAKVASAQSGVVTP